MSEQPVGQRRDERELSGLASFRTWNLQSWPAASRGFGFRVEASVTASAHGKCVIARTRDVLLEFGSLIPSPIRGCSQAQKRAGSGLPSTSTKHSTATGRPRFAAATCFEQMLSQGHFLRQTGARAETSTAWDCTTKKFNCGNGTSPRNIVTFDLHQSLEFSWSVARQWAGDFLSASLVFWPGYGGLSRPRQPVSPSDRAAAAAASSSSPECGAKVLQDQPQAGDRAAAGGRGWKPCSWSRADLASGTPPASLSPPLRR